MIVDVPSATDTLVDALAMLTEDVALSIITVVEVPGISTLVEGPVIVTSLEVPDTVIVVVRSSKETTVELSGMLTIVVTGCMDTAVVKSVMESTVEIEVKVKVVSIAVRITSDEEPDSTVKIVVSVPSVVSMDSAPMVHTSVDSVIVTLVVSLASVPSVHVLVVPGMATSVVEPPITDVLVLSGLIVETVTLSPSSQAYRAAVASEAVAKAESIFIVECSGLVELTAVEWG